METLVLNLYGLWFWLTRNYRAAHYSEAADTLNSARAYLLSDFCSRASTRDRGSLLPHQVQALAILEQHSALVERTSGRFATLSDCCRFVTEELTQSTAPSPHPHERVPSVLALTQTTLMNEPYPAQTRAA